MEVAVIAAKDDRFGETPLAIIHANKPIAVADIISFCNQRLSDYKVPRYVVIVPEPLPRLATGKISKRELKQKYANAILPRVR
jgi:fatty-acyl-CoA synthase